MTRTMLFTAVVSLLLCSSERSSGQVYGFAGGHYGSPTYGGYPVLGPWAGPMNYSPVPGYYGGRGYGFGPTGPRSVTWYTPGLGYSTSAQTGLPWQGGAPNLARHRFSAMPGDPAQGAIVDQSRARRRYESFVAARPRLPRNMDKPMTEPSVLPASDKTTISAEGLKTVPTEKSVVPASAK